MASTSSRKPSSFSTSIPPSSYDAFLSFRGEDTLASGINTFKDDEELETGGVIAEALIQAIEESKVFFVIFSKNYAYSKWCLNELVKIIECMKAKQRRVVPIFYDVDPSEVRRQSGGYGKAFAYHQKDANQEKKKEIQKWRTALTEAGNLAGYDLRNYRYESEVIENIIDDVLKTSHQLLHVGNNIIGMNLRLEKLKSLIEVESNDVRMVGIYGFGGIGKTTMSKAIYNEISTKFEGISFLENVREKSKDDYGLVQLQQQLINSILKRKNPTISNGHEGIRVIKKRLQTKKVLIVLDYVGESKQLEYLAGKHDWFGPGSRIIITSTDRHLLNVHGVDALHEVKELNQKEATQLFSQYAFQKDLPEEHYVELSKRVVDYTGGVPLALKVLGSFLFTKEIREWESELGKLKRKPNKVVQNVLRTSFDGLDDFEKELFLDIACFFKGQNENFVTRILDSCGFNATVGIKVLSDKCLITFFHGTIGMHDLLQEMGREVVREEYPRDLGKWTRLWEPDDVYRVLRGEMGTKAIEGIFLDMATSKEIQFTNEAFKQMNNLRLFKVYWSSHHYGVTKRDYKVLLPKDFEFPSYELSYLYWDRYPLKFLPSHFDGENLVELNLQSSNIKQIWKGNKCLQALKVVDLSHSKKLIKVSNFSCMKNLETLILEGCTSLRCVDQSIGVLKKLTLLSLKGCKRLRSLPSTVECLESLETLYLSSCSNLEIFPEIKRNMKRLLWLELGGTAIKELPSSVDHLTALQYLDLPECKNLKSLPLSICRLKSDVYLNLNRCSNLEAFPEISENMNSLQCLFLCETAIKGLPSSIENLVDLRLLVLDNCKNLATLPSSIYSFRYLTIRLANCSRLRKYPKKWNLEYSGWIGLQLNCLMQLSLTGTNLPRIYVVNDTLRNLELLNLSHFEMLEEIQWLPPSLREIDAYGCTGLKSLILSQIQSVPKLEESSETARLKFLEELYVSDHSNLETSPESQRTENFKGLKLDLPSLKWLEHLFLMDGTVANNLWCLSSLEYLDLSESSIHRIPAGITECCNLKHLIIGHCEKLKEIPNLPSSLISIDAYGCTDLGTLSTPSSLLWSSLLKWFKKVQPPLKGYRYNCTGISLGSNEIPEWVLHQEMGSQIRIELPMNWYQDDHFLGLAFFFLYPAMSHFLIKCRLTFCGDSEEDMEYFWRDSEEDMEYFRIDSGSGYCMIDGSALDRLWVGYYPKMAMLDMFDSKQYVHLQATFFCGWYDTKSCGIHLIDSQDHQHNHTPLGFHDTQHDEHYHMPMLNLPENSGDNRLAAEDINGNFKRSCDDAEHDQAED
ncbi:hypothetical protein PVL29_024849 [Vitis rotundifolia]|uniref:ADP-ribosyl cyclase/cyclic ADP-ribose hydrolase n=1 Tax=Vitis rotundifolia TaxID=103349 RepID=A0AA38YSZ4_VITRO|nr:hypothetical protein PVL29_024849 [Vitis rotundifolia]